MAGKEIDLSELTKEQREELETAFEKASKAQEIIGTYDQARVDRLAQAVAWAGSNKKTFLRLVKMSIDESGLGDPESRQNKRFKIRGVLRDALRQKSVGIIEEIPEKGIVKYAKPVGIIASIVPTTNPDLTPAGTAIYAIKARDVVIFSPHPRSKKITFETVRLMREALEREGAPADILQCLTQVNIPTSKALMAKADLALATGGQPMVRAAYSSVVHESIYNEMLECLQKEGAYLANEDEREQLRKVMWDNEGHRLADTVAIAPQKLAEAAGFTIPEDRKFIAVIGDGIGPEHLFSGEKLTTLLAIHKYCGEFENAITMMHQIYDVGGKGHSVGIYSFNDDHIHRLALAAPVSRIMVRQPQSKANAGAFNNGMPMTSSMGCGTWGGNITSENVHLKHYMNTTWVSKPIAEDRPTDEELFGDFYDPECEK